jgi:subtilisin-like proprotein convertase family protein/uncharacterized protein YvpB
MTGRSIAVIVAVIFTLLLLTQLSAYANTVEEPTATSTASATPSLIYVSDSPTQTATSTQLPQLTDTPESSNTPDITTTDTSTITPSATPSSTPADDVYTQALYEEDFVLFLPYIALEIPPTPTLTSVPTREPITTVLCRSYNPPLLIPDNDTNGVTSTIHTNRLGEIIDLDIYINISHTYIGDLIVNLTHVDSGLTISLIDRPGFPASNSGCGGNDIISILDDGASQYAEDKCLGRSPSISGTFKPSNILNNYVGVPLEGDWDLNITDHNNTDTGWLNQWCLDVTYGDGQPPPPPTATPVSLPAEARITNISGRDQAMPLDCESRSAVDWADYLGVSINEYEFFNHLPESDNPDVGFVGSVWGQWGQIPPNPYGVHAEPVAKLLRDYGLQAYAYRYLAWRAVRAEIALGRPVIAWVIGASNYSPPGRYYPVYYTASDGHTTVVSPYEHTVIVVGYSSTSVWLLDGDTIYTRTLEQFLDSWSVLRNMAILSHP